MYIAEISNTTSFANFLAAEATRSNVELSASHEGNEITFGDGLSITFGAGVVVFDGSEEEALIVLRRYALHLNETITFYHSQDKMPVRILPEVSAQSLKSTETLEIKAGIDDTVFLSNARQVFMTIEAWMSPKMSPSEELWAWVEASYDANPEIRGEARWSAGGRVVWFRSSNIAPFAEISGPFSVTNRRSSVDRPIQAIISSAYAIVFEAKEVSEDESGKRWSTYRGRMAVYMEQAHYRDLQLKKSLMIKVCRALCGPNEDMIMLDADAMIHDPANNGTWMTVFTYDPRSNSVLQDNQYVQI